MNVERILLDETLSTYTRHLQPQQTSSNSNPWHAQSLAHGAVGTALFAIERTHRGEAAHAEAHAWLTHATKAPISAVDSTGLFLGAPALAFVLDTTGHYTEARARLHECVLTLTRRRLRIAHARLAAGELAAFHEYDLLYGLTGLGAYLLRTAPTSSTMEQLLHYLIALARPLPYNAHLPGWWVGHDPETRPDPHGGHANFGLAHGFTGPLLLLSKALLRGLIVDGHHDALTDMCGWLTRWKQPGDRGPWWPETLTRAELATGAPDQPGPARPSWCYGTPGIARAGQLAALALRDTTLQDGFEHAALACLTDPNQLARLTDPGLCHGWAGLYQTTRHTVRDARIRELATHLPVLAAALTHQAQDLPASSGFLTGATGVALALTTAAAPETPTCGWDACLLTD
ncbi:lanthionine synthetase C family protein [Streptomyces sulphureus]|uniref:lanthionine synthetase C family protein n=1 Tax=Streptomyces sulphureus TaxID=47758 RepID=UPI000362A72F|nr:lanthionine synthetase C family protein [Streptomyces sulphureus]